MIRLEEIGFGSYGKIYKALPSKDHKNEIAVKRNFIDDSIDFSGSIREMDLLNRLRGHPYIVKLLSVSFGNPFITPNSPIINKKGYSNKEDYLHFVFEKGEKNLHTLIYEKEIHVSYLKLAMLQILIAVEYMHAKGVIHRDIKPGNLLWFVEKNKGCVKLCDFGLSKIKCFQEPSSPHVVTCWYRAPEICSRDPNYSFSSDMWSIGCVFYEMISKNALLLGYKDDDVKILSKIIGLIPSPNKDDIKKLSEGKSLTKDASPRSRKSWKKMINLSKKEIDDFNKYPGDTSTYDNYLDLLENLLLLNPEKRLTATEALNHPFFKPYQNIIDWARKNYPPIPKEEPIVKIIECKERKWATKLAFILFNNRQELEWYRHRILFQSIDMFDRYLNYLDKQDERKLESDYSGKYLTRYDTHLRYIVCLYMCIKYFTTLSVPVSFAELATDEYKTGKALIQAEEFEQKMLRDVLRFKVYRETLYENIDKLVNGDIANGDDKLEDTNDKERIIMDERKIRDLILAYGTMKSREIKLSDLLKELIDN